MYFCAVNRRVVIFTLSSTHWQQASKLSALQRFDLIWKKSAHQYNINNENNNKKVPFFLWMLSGLQNTLWININISICPLSCYLIMHTIIKAHLCFAQFHFLPFLHVICRWWLFLKWWRRGRADGGGEEWGLQWQPLQHWHSGHSLRGHSQWTVIS